MAAAFGQLAGKATISAIPNGANFDYTIVLKNTGTTDIGTFWFAWTPPGMPVEYDFLPSAPSSTSQPTGWVGLPSSGFPGYSIEYYNTSGSAIPPGQTATFRFATTDTPAALQGSTFGFPNTTSFIYSGFPEVGATARVNVATARAGSDFNIDGLPDLLLFHASDFRTYAWFLNGPSYIGSAPGPTLPAGWSVVGVGDFNGDGQPDLLLFHASDRRTYVWYLNGTTYVGSAPGPTLPAGWSVAGVADFNGDGQLDLLLFHASDHRTYVWYMNGASYSGAAAGPTLPAGWSVAGVGDFNVDGKPDLILFQASSLRTYVWYMSGPSYIGAAPGPTLPAGWSVAGVGDFNSDGKPDLVLFHASDLRTYVWYLNGTTYSGAAPGPTLPPEWSLIGH